MVSGEPDEEWVDQPYSNADMRKPGFDPFEAHKAWIKKRVEANKPETVAQARRRIARVRARVDRALAKLKAAPPCHPVPPPKLTLLKSPDLSEDWQAAVDDIKRRKNK
jgi:hypothetical protein